jgi:hypothetical protein
VTQSGDVLTATQKGWDEFPIAGVKIELFAEWQAQRNKTRCSNYPFVRFNELSNQQKKMAVLLCDQFEWYLVDGNKYLYDPEVKPVLLKIEKESDFQSQYGAVKAKDKFANLEYLLSSPFLREHVEKTLNEEEEKELLTKKAEWAILRFGLMTEGELATINPNDLGNNPDEWMNKLQEKIQRWEERIKEDQKHLAALTTLYERMDRYPFAKFLEEAKREVTTIEGSL